MAETIPELRVNLDDPCPLCGRGGTVNGGPCLACINQGLKERTMANQRMSFGGTVRAVKTAVKEIGEQPRLVVSVTIESATLGPEEIAAIAELQKAEVVAITIENVQGKLGLKPMAKSGDGAGA